MSLGAGGLQSGLQVTKWKQNWLFACTHTTVPVYPRIWRPLFCSHTHFKNVVLYKFCDLTSGPVWINPGLDSIYKTEEMRSSYFLCCFSWYMNVIILAGCLHSQQSATLPTSNLFWHHASPTLLWCLEDVVLTEEILQPLVLMMEVPVLHHILILLQHSLTLTHTK